jgi:hypothetical protein
MTVAMTATDMDKLIAAAAQRLELFAERHYR